jgi:coiled-coil domain-containing protein 115
MASDTIDELLERYLTLLDEYTTLRSALSKLQTGIYQDLARANFAAERGFRYGQDSYDDRMQATRRVRVSTGGAAASSFAVSYIDEDGAAENKDAQAVVDVPSEARASRPKPADPLRWFGVLTPMPLRQAQKQAVEAVEEVIPRLATLSAEMADVEIQVRRARKKRAKAEAAEKKESGLDVPQKEVEAA